VESLCIDAEEYVMHDDGKGLESIERGLTDDDPALVEAFQKWEVPAEVRGVLPGATTVPPWALAVFAIAAVSWVVSPGFGVLVAAAALFSGLLDGHGRHRDPFWSSRAAAEGSASAAPTEGGGRGDDSEWPPRTWRNG
jgi:hypothetical protein